MQDISLAETRKYIYDQMVDMKNGKISIDEALVSSKLAHQIIQSYEVEVKATEAITNASKLGLVNNLTGITFAMDKKQIENKE